MPFYYVEIRILYFLNIKEYDVTKRDDIIDDSDRLITRGIRYGLICTDSLGRIDLGHANPAGAGELWFEVTRPRGGDSEFYRVNYHQSMSKNIHGIGISTGIYRRLVVRRGLQERTLQGIALSIFLGTSHHFESLQDFWPYVYLTDSGYSTEDLISNLFGFYQAVNYMDYTSYLQICSKERAYQIWDFYGSVGEPKSRSVIPLLFPDPINRDKRHEPYSSELPLFMDVIRPIANPDYVRELHI